MCYLHIFKLVSFSLFLNQQNLAIFNISLPWVKFLLLLERREKVKKAWENFLAWSVIWIWQKRNWEHFFGKQSKGKVSSQSCVEMHDLYAPRKLAALMIGIANYLLSAWQTKDGHFSSLCHYPSVQAGPLVCPLTHTWRLNDASLLSRINPS